MTDAPRAKWNGKEWEYPAPQIHYHVSTLCTDRCTPELHHGGAPAPGMEAPAAPVDSAPFVASRPELGAPPPVKHPAPWRWKSQADAEPPVAGGETLLDANGITLIGGICDPDGENPVCMVGTPRVRALTEAAPEMFEMLRDYEEPWPGQPAERCGFCGVVGADRFAQPGDDDRIPHAPTCKLALLLARIDKASK